MTMVCTRCDALVDREVPDDPSEELPCPYDDCAGRLTAPPPDCAGGCDGVATDGDGWCESGCREQAEQEGWA